MLSFALFGAGRIGQLHAANIAANPRSHLSYVYDVDQSLAAEVAHANGAAVSGDVESMLADGNVDAVLIASSTDTHVDLIAQSALAGKAILCEKPIDLDIDRVDRCWAQIKDCSVPIQIGFNRRFDPSHRGVIDAVHNGEIGRLEQVIITSRDPAPPPADYLKRSGGLFRDMMIHDFDLARCILGAEPVEISAMATVMVDQAIGQLGDVDTAMVTLMTAGGVLCHINNSRRAVYGYDQRVEAFGAKGMVQSENLRPNSVRRYGATTTGSRDPLLHFFIERYQQAYVAELDAFIDTVNGAGQSPVSFEDGRRALLLADAAYRSLRSGARVKLKW